MNKKFVIFFLLIFVSIEFASAQAVANVAYVLEDGSTPSGEITNIFNQMNLNYDIIRDSQIVTTDFSNYQTIVVGDSVDRDELLPLTQKSAIFFHRQIADDAWHILSSGTTTRQKIKATNLASFAYQDVNINLATNEVIVYTLPTGKKIDYLTLTGGSGVTTVGLSTGSNQRPAVAYSTRQVNGESVKSFYFGAPESQWWSQDGEKIFENALNWIIEDTDQDEDGFALAEDCDDTNPNINPGETDIPYDGIDQNCNGFDNIDADNDGFCAEGMEIEGPIQCLLDVGNSEGTDCDDLNLNINPGSTNPLLNCINDAPVFTGNINDFNWEEDSSLENVINLNNYFNDFDSEITFSVSGNNEIDVVISNNGLVSFRSPVNFAGTEEIFFTASDGENSVDSNRINLNVLEEGDAPVFSELNCQQIINEDTEHNCELNANDLDGDNFFFSVVSENNIDCEINGNELTYTPAENFNGNASCTLRVTDDDGSNSITLEFTVNSVNDAVFFTGEINDITWQEDESPQIALNLNDYFEDVDSQLMFNVLGNNEINVTISNGGDVSFSTEENYFGNETIYFVASDGEFQAMSNTISLIVNSIGDSPHFLEQNCLEIIDEDTEYNCELNVEDPEEDEFIISVDSQNKLSCEINGTMLKYIPQNNFNGDASCILRVSNIQGFDLFNFNVFVENINDAPEITSESPSSGNVRAVENTQKSFLLDVLDIDSNISVSWILNGINVLEEISKKSEFKLNRPKGVYFLEAKITDGEFTQSRFWNVIFGSVSEFSCSEVGGRICQGNDVCGGSLTETQDTNLCCTTQCVPDFRDANACEILSNEVDVEIKKPLSSDNDIEIGKAIKVEFRITNNHNDDQDFDAEVHLYDVDKRNSVSETSTLVELKKDSSRTTRVDLEIPEDIDLDDSYAVFVVADDKVCNQAFNEIKISRPDNLLRIKEFNLPSDAMCGDVISGNVKIENLGTDEQDVILDVKNNELKINEKEEFTLEAFGENDNLKKEFFFNIPTDMKTGNYIVNSRIVYGSKSESINKEIYVTCVPPKIKESTSVPINNKIVIGGASLVRDEIALDNKNNFVLVSNILMLNLMLLASVSILYLSWVKSRFSED